MGDRDDMKNKCVVHGCRERGIWVTWLNYAFCQQHRTVGDERGAYWANGRWHHPLFRGHDGCKRGKPRDWKGRDQALADAYARYLALLPDQADEPPPPGGWWVYGRGGRAPRSADA